MKSPFKSKYRKTQGFGERPDYYKQFGLKGHEGIDLVPTGTSWEVISLTDGVVVNESDDPRSGAYGIWCTIWSPTHKLAFQYCHLSENYVRPGDKITAGQKIGNMGATGNTQGAHLHMNLFQVDDNGVRLNKNNGYLGGIDPEPFLLTDDAPIVDQQKIIDQLREERDKNHNLYQSEIKKREEAEKLNQSLNIDYDGVKQELTSYKAIISTYATLLNVKPTETEKIAGEIKRLVGIEDQFKSISDTVDTLMSQTADLQAEITTLKGEKSVLIQERDDSRTSLQQCIDNKTYKTLDEYPYIERLLSLFRR